MYACLKRCIIDGDIQLLYNFKNLDVIFYILHIFANIFISLFSSHSCDSNACKHVSNGVLLTEIFDFYYASRAKIIHFFENFIKSEIN